MNVHPAGNSPQMPRWTRPLQSPGQDQKVDVQSAEDKAARTDDRGADTPMSDKPAKGHGPKSERAQGVLRLLAAGHFNAVAEQRLRANFADLISAPQADSETADRAESGAVDREGAG